MKIFLFILFISFVSCNKEAEHSNNNEIKNSSKVETYYTCSMHPQIKEKGPGKCPICGMNLTKVEVDHSDTHDHSEHQVKEDVYYCESSPDITSHAPGECPIDGTPMLKKASLEGGKVVAKMKLRKSQVNHFRAELFEATTMKMNKVIRLLGTLVKSEDKKSNIPARISGRVEKVFVESKGAFIKKGDPVVKLYSSALITSGEEYLISRENYLKNKANQDLKELFLKSIERLKLFGILEFQLENWAKLNKIPRDIIIYSPVTGIVVNKNAIKGKYFNEGQSFFDLVDLSSMWVEMDVYEHDSSLVKLGQSITIEFSALPGEKFQGDINFIDPIINPKTRTLKVRTTLNNLNGNLRPGMVGDVNLKIELEGTPIVVPRSAVIDTGKRKVVWLDLGKHKYQAITVSTGFESAGYMEIKNGLKEGQKVVIDGNFLLDSQAQLVGGYIDTEESSGHNH
jgi:multidrug efflux pump subunit AcrA (membrane-fusion protein)